MKRAVFYTCISALLLVLQAGCYHVRASSGGGQTSFTPPREVDAGDVAVPNGYRIEVVAAGLTFPTGVAFDSRNVPHVVEAGYSYGEVWTKPRLLRVQPGTQPTEIASGSDNGPWTGVAFADGFFYIAEGGERHGGRILRIGSDGETTVLVSDLPTMGDHHTNGPAIGPDGSVYFATGTATNSGVVGPDNAQFGWLKRKPDFHDVPCRDVTLAGHNFESDDPDGKRERIETGAFSPFGRSSTPGQIVQGRVPCSGAVMKVAATGGRPELVAWGFRNPFGMAFAPHGELYVSENGYDDRGSRPVWGTADVLWKVTPGTWYGWPDYSAGRSLEEEDFRAPGKRPLRFLLAQHPGNPPQPATMLGVHSSSNGFDFSRSAQFGYEAQAFVAQFGDQAPTVGKVLAPVGFKIVRVDPESGVVHDFATNRLANGPASKVGGRGFERPIAARFDNTGSALYIVDFGVLLETKEGAVPQQGTGVLWRVTRDSRQ
jgi:glucose/arabinose dehydrogenase